MSVEGIMPGDLESDRPIVDAEEDGVLAVREALADVENGDTGVPLEEFDREFRRRHGIEVN
jgi:hypothetical protein